MKKKGVSELIGYILLISFVLITSVLVYTWMKTYVPRPIPQCPEGVSIFIKEIECNNSLMKITLRNNGRFDIAGYFIRATNSTNQTIATIDLSNYVAGEIKADNSILFAYGNENSFSPGDDEKINSFNLGQNILSVEITPVRFQVEENKNRFVSCGNAKVEEKITCG